MGTVFAWMGVRYSKRNCRAHSIEEQSQTHQMFVANGPSFVRRSRKQRYFVLEAGDKSLPIHSLIDVIAVE